MGQVVLLTCPTERFGVPDRFATRRVVAQRNALLRQLVAATRGGAAAEDDGGGGGAAAGGSPLMLLDLDTMTKYLPRAAALSPHDFHYQVGGGLEGGRRHLAKMRRCAGCGGGLTCAISLRSIIPQCYPTTATGFRFGSLEWAGGDGSPTPCYPPRRFSHLNIAANGWCADPVNYSAWQLLLHMLCD